jgi:hypothetical protein
MNLNPLWSAMSPKGGLAEKFATQVPCGNISEKGKLWLKTTTFGGADLNQKIEKVQNDPKVMTKIFLKWVRNIFHKPFMCYISTKSVRISFKLVQCTCVENSIPEFDVTQWECHYIKILIWKFIQDLYMLCIIWHINIIYNLSRQDPFLLKIYNLVQRLIVHDIETQWIYDFSMWHISCCRNSPQIVICASGVPTGK